MNITSAFTVHVWKAGFVHNIYEGQDRFEIDINIILMKERK